MDAVVLQDASVSAPGDLDDVLMDIPSIPVRKKLRWCCAFGTDLRVKLGKMTLPWLKVGRVLNVDELGPHRYDGATAAIDDRRKNAFPKGEHNGLMYTCHGGFIDTAHVRETVDWAAFFISEFDRHLEEGSVLELGDEGGDRVVTLRPVPAELIEQHGRERVIISLAQWMAHQVMAWHEYAQWYGWSILALYPEVVSGFSPEDMYSNAVGLRLLDDLDIRRNLASEKIYNRHIDKRMKQELRRLGAVPKDVGRQAVQAVDHVWWDSDERLPAKGLVRRRYMDTDTELEPWLLPDRLVSPELRASLTKQCGENPRSEVMRIPFSFGDVAFGELLTLEITVDRRLSKQPIFRSLGRPVNQDDFPVLLEGIRAQNRAEFGQRADRPD